MQGADVLIAIVAIVMFYGWIPIAVWLYLRKKSLDRQLTHTERMTALELGRTPPDLEAARSEAEQARYRSAAWVAVAVPVGLAGVALGMSLSLLLVFGLGSFPLLALLAVVWVVCGYTGVTAITQGLATLRQFPTPTTSGGKAADADILSSSSPAAS